ncbi:MAG: hypothetical protein WC285_01465 [Candidatus Gracilibacteria bacterium]|jgi:hypothetical protein
MQITITSKEGPVAKILKKLTVIFFGIFLTSLIFALATSFAGKYGIWLGLLLCGLLIFGGFYYVGRESRIRIVTWTMLITIIAFIILFIAGISFVTANLDFAK